MSTLTISKELAACKLCYRSVTLQSFLGHLYVLIHKTDSKGTLYQLHCSFMAGVLQLK